MSDESVEYPAEREWRLPEAVVRQGCDAISAAWRRSAQTLGAVKKCLQQVDDRVATVAVSGSLGRMEQLSHSDADFIVLVRDEVSPASPQAQAAFDSVWKQLEPLELVRPKPTGIYAAPSNRKQLCDPAGRGQIAEEIFLFGKRIQLLLDSQPVYGDEAFRDTVTAIVDRYTTNACISHHESVWKYLLDDLIRYFRSLSVMYRWEARDRPGYWRLRNVKLRHSRLVTYAGLLLLLTETDSRPGEQLEWLKHHLPLTPLERVALISSLHPGEEFSIIVDCYERFLSSLGDEKFFAELTDENDSRLREHPLFGELDENSRKLSAAVSRFLLKRMEETRGPIFDGLFF